VDRLQRPSRAVESDKASVLIECRAPTPVERDGVPYRSPCHEHPIAGHTERPAIVMVRRYDGRDFTIYGRQCVGSWEQWGDVPIVVLTQNCPTMDEWYEANVSSGRGGRLTPAMLGRKKVAPSRTGG
jgi:hypothetical protein